MAKNSVENEAQEEIQDHSLNVVSLRGRVSAPAVEKILPSEDRVVEFRLIVSRPDRAGVDTLDIAAWNAKMRRRALALKEDEWIEVEGAVRRRFWQGAHGLASRWQIEASEITRI